MGSEQWEDTFGKWWDALPTVRDEDPTDVREIEEDPVQYYIAAACWQAALASRPVEPVEGRLRQPSDYICIHCTVPLSRHCEGYDDGLGDRLVEREVHE